MSDGYKTAFFCSILKNQWVNLASYAIPVSFTYWWY